MERDLWIPSKSNFHEFRLMTLYPGIDEDEINYNFFTASFVNNSLPHYAVRSHKWGPLKHPLYSMLILGNGSLYG